MLRPKVFGIFSSMCRGVQYRLKRCVPEAAKFAWLTIKRVMDRIAVSLAYSLSLIAIAQDCVLARAFFRLLPCKCARELVGQSSIH